MTGQQTVIVNPKDNTERVCFGGSKSLFADSKIDILDGPDHSRSALPLLLHHPCPLHRSSTLTTVFGAAGRQIPIFPTKRRSSSTWVPMCWKTPLAATMPASLPMAKPVRWLLSRRRPCPLPEKKKSAAYGGHEALVLNSCWWIVPFCLVMRLGSGKTHTMTGYGNGDESGLIPRLCNAIFDR